MRHEKESIIYHCRCGGHCRGRTVTYLNRSVTPEELLFRENVEALSEYESGGKDGALWSNAAGYCFGFPEYGEGQDRIVFTYRDGSRYCMCVYDKSSGKSVQFDSVSVCGVNRRIGEMTWAFRDERNAAFAFTSLPEDAKLSGLTAKASDESIIIGIGRL